MRKFKEDWAYPPSKGYMGAEKGDGDIDPPPTGKPKKP